MPVINLGIKDLEKLVGEGFDLDQFNNEIPMIGATIEKVEGNDLAVEFFPDRPDLFSVEGIARAYRKFKGVEEKDLSETHRIRGSTDITLTVDPGVKKIRPIIGAAFIRGVNIDEDTLISIMNLQEKLHITVGRKRKKVAIGIHDASPLSPPFKYWAAKPDEVSFVPLQKTGDWNLKRILEEHEKGKAYAWVLEGMDTYPIITDSKGQVLSFPPIINGELTKVTERTEDIFVDCTGWDLKAVTLAVNIVCAQLIDRGGTVEDVNVIYPEDQEFTDLGITNEKWPRMDWRETEVDVDWALNWLGKDLGAEELEQSLGTMGFEKVEIKDGVLRCLIPPWRNDILHQADMVEDIAIGYGFQRFSGENSKSVTIGSERKLSTISRYIRQTMIGLGFLEVRTISLSNEEAQFSLMEREEIEHIKLTNPITIDHTMLRLSVIPTLLSLLRSNKHRDLPQKIFENADIMVKNHSMNMFCALSEDNKASFTEAKGYIQRVLQDLGIAFVLEPADLGWYIKGRCAAVMVEIPEGNMIDREGPFPELKGGKMVPLGHFGEIHPRLISAHELSAPVSAMEIDLDLVLNLVDL